MDWCQAESVEDPWRRSTSDGQRKPHHHIWRRSSAWCPTHSKPVTGQARYLAQCQVLLPVETTTPLPTFYDDHSIVTLVHAFVSSRVDYCIGLLAGTPKSLSTLSQKSATVADVSPLSATVTLFCDSVDRA